MKPSSEAELSALILEAKGPLSVQGGGTRRKFEDGPILETADITGVSLYEPGAMTLVAKAGTPISEINDLLAKENQRIAFEVPDYRDVLGTSGQSTIGGVAASNASGPRRISAGACRDFMLGVRFVDGAGQIIKNGGRVMKNVTGYDLVKLMAGSHGTLGVLTEVSLKVLPSVETSLSLRLEGLDPSQSVASLSAALGSPFEVSGAARDIGGAVWLRLEGFEASVRYRAAQLQSKLAAFGSVDVVEDSVQTWDDLRDVRAFASGDGDLWRISVKPSDAPGVLDRVPHTKAQLDWGGGLIWLETTPGVDIRAKIEAAGHATRVRGNSGDISMFQPESAGVARLTAGLRAKFDPRGILNSGLMEQAA